MNCREFGRRQSWSVQRYHPTISHKRCRNTIKDPKSGYLILDPPKHDPELKQFGDEYKQGPTKWNKPQIIMNKK
jgi:hypothetical protein